MTTTRALRYLLFMALLIPSSSVWTQERSDYDIQRSFVAEYNAIMQGIDSATSVVECVDFASRIADLDSVYAPYSAMLDKALYPDGFKGRIQKANAQLALMKDKLNIIETQYQRISELEAQVQALSAEVSKLTGENSDMLSEMDRLRSSGATDRATIDSLNALVISLKKGLKERDDLIFALVDSLFMQYDKQVGEMGDKEKAGVIGKLERRNVLTNVKKSVADNLQFLESTTLTPADLAALAKEQQAFASKWSGVGAKLAKLYIGSKSKRGRELAAVDTMLSQWQRSVDQKTWDVLNAQFSSRGIGVVPFSSGEEFYGNVMVFVDSQLVRARVSSGSEQYHMYSLFADTVWKPHIEKDWIPVLLASGKLTEEQQNELNNKIDEWERTVGPPATLWYIIIILAIVLVGLYLYSRYRKVKKPGAPPT
jgi:hypothetical protein